MSPPGSGACLATCGDRRFAGALGAAAAKLRSLIGAGDHDHRRVTDQRRGATFHRLHPGHVKRFRHSLPVSAMA